jgi:hypothetical protein
MTDITPNTPYADLPELLTPKQFAAKLGVNPNTVYYKLRWGHIPYKRFGGVGKMFIHRSVLLNEAPSDVSSEVSVG